MVSHQVATFQGYVHSTRDALLIFEAVRRGQLPKITRRLRDDERKMIQSGTIFVFDEAESSIKRWTDGMIWSPSRILNNFLVYREVEKKDPKPATDQPAFATSHSSFAMQGAALNSSHPSQHSSVRSVPLTLMPNAMDADAQMTHYKQEHSGYHSVEGVSSSSNPGYSEHDGFFGGHAHHHHSAHAQAHAQAAGLVGLLDEGAASSSAVKREVELDRTIVGSLTSSYPFVRDGLCKKTISIQVEGSTQHLISYYKIDDVHHGRLTIPSNLPELFCFSISPIFLNKSNFRYPPIVEMGPDGLPRYVGESTDNAMRASGHVSSGNESYSSGSEARHEGLGRAASRSLSIYSPALPSDPTHNEFYSSRYPHQIGGDGILPNSANLPSSSTSSLPYRSRRSSDAPRRRANSRYEPYQQAPGFGHGMVPTQLYSNSPAMDHGPVSPSGRRAFFPPPRGYSDAEAAHASEHTSFGMHRQDAGFFAIGQVDHASGQNGGHLNQPHASMDQVDQHGDLQQSFQPGPVIPFVPSQPSRSHTSYSTGADLMHGRYDAVGMKQEQADPFHFSSRLARGSWDSNQPSHPNVVHHVQQPPATSQGLTAISIHSQSNFGGPVYGRLVGSPPNTSSSHDSRHSYMGSGPTHATGRIGELVDGVLPTTAARLEEANYSSRPMSRAGEGGYVGDLDSAGVVQTGPLEALQVDSDPTSPYARSHQHPLHASHAQHQILGNDAAGVDGYGRPATEMDAQPPFYPPPQTSYPPQEHDGVQLDQQAFGRHAQDGYASTQAYASNGIVPGSAHNEQSWSDPVQEGNGATTADQSYPSRPGTSHDQAYHHQYRNEGGDANADESGLEKVMLTRPAA
uniref:Itd1 n=1 Tax=Ustilago esculenta TaxID=185366 RepID=A0A5S9H9R3_9BASI|nr:Itd1 [Ustilago esculenta]